MKRSKINAGVPLIGPVNQFRLSTSGVREALGLSSSDPNWKLSSAAVGAALHDDIALPASQLFPALLDRYDLRVLLYNGEYDFDCNIVGTLSWLADLKWSGSKALREAERKPWGGNGSRPVFGYSRNAKRLTQLTLVGSGHMVPMYVPEVALQMITMLIKGDSF